MNQVTRILNEIGRGQIGASDQLLPAVYEELRRMAAAKMDRERPGQTLQPTALVHEAYLRLMKHGGGGGADGHSSAAHWDNRGHFFAAAAEAMRRILIERARHKQAARHGGGRQGIDLEKLDVADEDRPGDLLALDEALTELERHDADAAKLVKLRFFAGFGHQEAAEAMAITRRAADRLWSLARAWLYQWLSSD